MTSQDLDNIDWSFLREQEPWQFGQQNVTAAESDSASSQSLSTRNSRGTSSRARNWCFTLNNPSAEELYNLHTILPQAREFRFIVFQLEQGLDGATPHVQGYIEFNCQLRLNAAKRLISQRAHLEVRRESTTSDSILREAGNEVGRALEIWRAARRAARAEERPARAQKRPRRRLDRSTIVGRVLSYDDEILQGVAQYQILKRDQRRWKSKVYVLVGEPGTGKSKWALDNFLMPIGNRG